MIYLVQSYRLTEENDPTKGICSCEKILKIGYTDDLNCEVRFCTYKSHNPGVELIYTILGGTEEQEKKLHYKFKELKLEGWAEWFSYSKDIVEYVKSVTLEELDNLPKAIPESKIPKTTEDIEKSARLRREVRICYDQVTKRSDYIPNPELESTLKTLLRKCGLRKSIKGFLNLEHFYKEFGLTSEEQESARVIIELDYSDRSKEEQDFLYNFDLLTQFPNRMKLVCDAGLSGKFNMDYIFRQIPGEYGNYYRVLGPDKIKACAYTKNKMEKAYNKIMFNTDQMAIDIYSVFNEGDKLSTQEIVDRLGPIYEKYGNPNKPKAVDINDYFETKVAKVTLPDKSRINGFKLIKRLQ